MSSRIEGAREEVGSTPQQEHTNTAAQIRRPACAPRREPRAPTRYSIDGSQNNRGPKSVPLAPVPHPTQRRAAWDPIRSPSTSALAVMRNRRRAALRPRRTRKMTLARPGASGTWSRSSSQRGLSRPAIAELEAAFRRGRRGPDSAAMFAQRERSRGRRGARAYREAPGPAAEGREGGSQESRERLSAR
jgi:hypothetical protein